VVVADSGIGIEKEHLPRVFDEFYRVDARRTSTVRGAGLGLAIVKKLVEIHGGSVSITSEPGQGTRVTVLLPCQERGARN
jgi:two-component system phosphate regulon sensor histidine kinase PhoR